MSWIRDLALWVEHWAHTPYGPLALFAIAFAESSFFPIPPDVLLIALSLAVPEKAIFYAVICSIGSLLGGIFGFLIGQKGGRPILLKLFSVEKIETAAALYRKYDVWAVGIAGFTPIPYKLFTISAGVFNLDFKRFLFASTVSRSARFFLVAGFIALFGPLIKPFLEKQFNLISIIFVVLLIGGFYFIRVISKRMSRNAPRSNINS